MTEQPQPNDTLIQITGDGMGRADQELQHTLVSKYLQLLNESDMLPGVIAFYAEGVRLVCTGSPVLEQLRALSEKGVYLIVCSTCLNYLGLTEELQVGLKGGMTDIIEAQWRASKVITL